MNDFVTRSVTIPSIREKEKDDHLTRCIILALFSELNNFILYAKLLAYNEKGCVYAAIYIQ